MLRKIDGSDRIVSNIGIDISEGIVWDQLTTAFEGGSNYWIQFIKPTLNEYEYIQDVPFDDKAELYIKASGDDKMYVLNRASLTEGLKVMYNLYPRQFSKVILNAGDADTGDIFLQCCLFGRVVYA